MRLAQSRLERIGREYQDLLGLGDWHVIFRSAPLKNLMGQCNLEPNERRATISVDPRVIKDEPQLRDTVIHELIHLYFSHTDEYVLSLIRLLYRRNERAVGEAYDAYSRFREDAVVRITQAFMRATGAR